jgi:DNA-binding IclR family transcriptional regulator
MKQDSPAVKSADRVFDVLEFVGDAPSSPTFSQLLTGLEIPRSSLFHLLTNLVARGYLEADPGNGGYRLGPNINRLAAKSAEPSLAVLVEPYLRKLSGELNETSGFYIRAGDTVETVATASSTQALSYTMRVGESAPLYAVSGGKILLARLPDREFDAYLARVVFEAVTPATLTSGEALREQVAKARIEGFAYSHEEFTPGITGISTIVTSDKRIFGSLNLAVPTARFTPDRDGSFRRALVSTSSAIGYALATRFKA